MQTFLPYPSFSRSVKVLDNKRLGKQRVEAMQILNVLSGKSKGWRNHPAVKMWIGHEAALGEYMNACITEWINRGFKNTMKLYVTKQKTEFPRWFGNKIFHLSHRSNLLRKDKDWYGQFGWLEPDNLPYFWPVK